MSRLPGGVFVGMVTLLGGLMFARIGEPTSSPKTAASPVLESSTQVELEAELPAKPEKKHPQVAAELSTRL